MISHCQRLEVQRQKTAELKEATTRVSIKQRRVMNLNEMKALIPIRLAIIRVLMLVQSVMEYPLASSKLRSD